MASFEPVKFKWVTGPDGNRRKKALPGSPIKVRYRKPNGQSGSHSVNGGMRAAEQWAALNEADKARGEWVDQRVRRAVFSEWADSYEKGLIRLAPTTARRYQQYLDNQIRPYFQRWPIAQIDYQDVEDFIAHLYETGLGEKSVRDAVSVLSQVMKAAMRSRAIKENPAAGHHVKVHRKRGKTLRLDELERLVDGVPARYERYVPALLLLIYTGMRPAELCGLRVGRVNVMKRTVHVAETLTNVGGRLVAGPTKTDQERVLPIPEFLADILAAHLARRAEQLDRALTDDDYVFVSMRGGGLDSRKLRARVLVPALEAAGLPRDFRTYDLRHSHASELIDMGASPLAVQERLGHTDIVTTLRVYGHLFQGVQEKLAGQLDEARRLARGRQVGAEVVVLRPAVAGHATDTRDTGETPNLG